MTSKPEPTRRTSGPREQPLYKRLPRILMEEFNSLFRPNARRIPKLRRPPMRRQLTSLFGEIFRNPFRAKKSSFRDVDRAPWHKELSGLMRSLVALPALPKPRPIGMQLRSLSQMRGLIGTMTLALGLGLGMTGVYMVKKSTSSGSQRVARVAGAPITLDQVRHRMEIQIGGSVLRELVNEEMALQFAQTKHLLPSDESVRERAREFRANPTFNQEIRDRSITPEELNRACRVMLIQEAIQGQVSAVSEKEIQAYYRSQTDPRDPCAKFYKRQTSRIAVVATKELAEARRADAELHRGRPFTEVARIYNKEPGPVEGGDPVAARHDRSYLTKMNPAFEVAIFRLKPGQWTPPHKVGHLWVLVKCIGREPAHTIPLEQVRKECGKQAAALKASQTPPSGLAAEYAEFRGRARLQVFWDQYYYDLTGKGARTASASP